MRLSLSLVSAVFAATGLVGATPLKGRNTGHHTIEVPSNEETIHSPFLFTFSDTTRNPADTSILEVSFYNLTYRGFIANVNFTKEDYTLANATLTVPANIVSGGYDIVVQEIDHDGSGPQLYEGVTGVAYRV
ncbi:hypothetical protein V8D89_013110 [Ganoderma adspersum]